jgi:hypothetical protein
MRFLRLVSLFAMLAAANVVAQAAQLSQADFAHAKAYGSGALDAVDVVMSDLNGDGHPDIILAGSFGQISVLFGNGDGTFQSPTVYNPGGYSTWSIVVGDLNADGHPDLVLAGCEDNYCVDGAVLVMLNNGDGTFQTAVTYGSGGSGGFRGVSIAVADINKDERLDILVANNGSDSVGVLLGNGDGTLQAAISYGVGGSGASSIAVGDLNGDGNPDLAIGVGRGLSVLLGNGDGTFQTPITNSSVQAGPLAIGELNGDGKLDLVAINYAGFEGVAVLLGNGDGTFQTAVTYSTGGDQPDWVVVGDVNGDGNPDVLVANLCAFGKHGDTCLNGGAVTVLGGNGDGTLQTPLIYASAGVQSESVALGDVNGDGKPDIMVANRCTNNNNCYGTVGVLLNKTLLASTNTVLTSSQNPSQPNQSVTLTATTTANPPIRNGEIVTFYNGTTAIGTGATTNGIATLTTSFSKSGKYTIKASYPGDAFHKVSKGTVKEIVNP